MDEKEKQVEQITVYSNEPDSFLVFLKKIVRFRSLIWVFAIRDLKVKYAQTIIGVGWTIIQPLTALTIFTFFFGFLLNWKTEGIAYPVYVLSGLLGWNFFSYTVNAGTMGLQESAHLIKKIYFPKSIIPLSKMILGLVDLAFSLLLLIPLLIYFGQSISWKVIFLPIILFYNVICALGLVFWISAFAYKKRDLLHLVPFLLTFGIWFSPVFFSSNILPTKYAFLLDLNPMANVVQMWRWSLFGFGQFNWIWGVNFLVVFVLLLLGIYVYNRKESGLADFV
jgi:lipopolysaccharide transport system permease protein